MKKLLLLAPVLLLVGCNEQYATSQMTAIGEKVCSSHGGLDYVQGLDISSLTFLGWKAGLSVQCEDGTHIETPEVDNLTYRIPKSFLTDKK